MTEITEPEDPKLLSDEARGVLEELRAAIDEARAVMAELRTLVNGEMANLRNGNT